MKDRILILIISVILGSCASFDYRRNDPLLYVTSMGTLDTAYFHAKVFGLYHVTNTKEHMSDSIQSFLIRKRDAVRVDAAIVSREEIMRHRQ